MEGVILKVFSILATQRYEGLYKGKEGDTARQWARRLCAETSGTHVSLLLYLTGPAQQNTSYWSWFPYSLRILVLSCKWAITAICMLFVTWQYIERKTKGALERLAGILSSVTIKDCLKHWTKQEGHRPSRRIMEMLWKLFWKGQAPKSCYTLTST